VNIKKFLFKCSLENKSVNMMYLDQRGRITKRTIFVKRIDQNKVIAFCTLREQNRTFELDNILAAGEGNVFKENKQCYSRSQYVTNFQQNNTSGA
jgi:predicted DNA-binding transcriptional regulator YafY